MVERREPSTETTRRGSSCVGGPEDLQTLSGDPGHSERSERARAESDRFAHAAR